MASRWMEQKRRLQRELVLKALQKHRGCRAKAARSLGMSVRGLQYVIAKLKREGVKVPEGFHPPSHEGAGAGLKQAPYQKKECAAW